MSWRPYYVSAFSGIEAATVAWAPLEWVPVCFSEIDPFPSAVLAERFPKVPNLGDITRVDWSEISGFVDVVVGGSPCQSFSVAGRREGLEGESGLMWEFVRCVREVRPEWVVWENVPGVLSSTHGEDLRCLLAALAELGYGVAGRVLDAQFFGVAQRRRRFFVVGRLGDPRGAAEILFEPNGVPWDPGSSREKREALASGAGRGPASSGFIYKTRAGAGSVGYAEECGPTIASARADATVLCMGDATSKASVDEDMCGTLKAHNSKEPPVVSFAANQRGEVRLQGGDGSITGAIPATQSGKQVQGVAQGPVVRRLTPRECERLQGFPDDWTKVPYRGRPAGECPDTPRYRAIGNSMAVPVMRWIGERIQQVMDGEFEGREHEHDSDRGSEPDHG